MLYFLPAPVWYIPYRSHVSRTDLSKDIRQPPCFRGKDKMKRQNKSAERKMYYKIWNLTGTYARWSNFENVLNTWKKNCGFRSDQDKTKLVTRTAETAVTATTAVAAVTASTTTEKKQPPWVLRLYKIRRAELSNASLRDTPRWAK